MSHSNLPPVLTFLPFWKSGGGGGARKGGVIWVFMEEVEVVCVLNDAVCGSRPVLVQSVEWCVMLVGSRC